MTKEQFDEITGWQKATFPSATSDSKIHHLMQEIKELSEEKDPVAKSLEYADCFFLLFGAAAADGYSYEEICAAIDIKFGINKRRKWGKPDENGVVNHVKQ